MPANLRAHSNLPVGTSEQPVLYLALELGWDSWKLAFASGLGSAPRLRQIPARDVGRLVLEIAEAKRRLSCTVRSSLARRSISISALVRGRWR
jgi:hypothetical protein